MSKKQIDRETMPYRPCAGIVLFNAAGKVWAGKRMLRKNDELTGSQKLWQFPQGGIDDGESPLAAAKRELYEETGIRSATLIEESKGWIEYELPDHLLGIALKGKYRGQTQKWFAFRFLGDDSEVMINPPPEGNETEFQSWDWVDLETMPMLVVPFKQAVYEAVVAQFRHIVVN